MPALPLLTVDWEADNGQQWTVPVGGGVGKIFHLGKLPVNTQLRRYYNVVQPDNGANWQIRFQVQLIVSKMSLSHAAVVPPRTDQPWSQSRHCFRGVRR